MEARLSDVAKRAGVSVNTASRVLNDKGYISQATREKVMDAIKELNYHPNDNARNLLKQRSGMVGLLMPTIVYPHHAEIISVVENELSKRDLKLLLCNTEQNPQTERGYLQMFLRARVEGLILCNNELGSKEYENVPFPLVSIDRFVEPGVSFVSSDHRKGGRLAAHALIASGCRHVLQVSGLMNEKTPWNERHVVFEELMHKAGIECRTHALDVHLYMPMYETQRKIVREQLARYPEADGFFGSDLWAVSALQEVLLLGKKVPEDFAIVGYDGTIFTNMTVPAITTIAQQTQGIARSAVDFLIRMIEAKGATSYEVLHDVELVQQGTTLPLPKDLDGLINLHYPL